ncbi:MarR family winged helix-turn-helix transcriptional regulator [Thermoactinomyces mirandus]|uniref:MarR family transcriptional regulator n=1 Tax=Thermoactinomyces mirandus TaxID=2756294 RepID=A0A7W1XSZ2_9BACL|nr:MarR family transcriptional regulator [Thermoactinomyces mirandus]MBA4602640.1 MarR family transcriptional regulator [Thermoactinomyces mirandus]
MDHGNILSRIQALTYSITRKIGHQIEGVLSELGLTRGQFYILKTIESQGKCRATDIANMMEVKPSAVTLMIDRLEARRWVRRSQDTSDRRVIIIELTPEGKEVLEKARKISDEVVRRYFAHLSYGDLNHLLKIYEKLERIAVDKHEKSKGEKGNRRARQ